MTIHLIIYAGPNFLWHRSAYRFCRYGLGLGKRDARLPCNGSFLVNKLTRDAKHYVLTLRVVLSLLPQFIQLVFKPSCFFATCLVATTKTIDHSTVNRLQQLLRSPIEGGMRCVSELGQSERQTNRKNNAKFHCCAGRIS